MAKISVEHETVELLYIDLLEMLRKDIEADYLMEAKVRGSALEQIEQLQEMLFRYSA